MMSSIFALTAAPLRQYKWLPGDPSGGGGRGRGYYAKSQTVDVNFVHVNMVFSKIGGRGAPLPPDPPPMPSTATFKWQNLSLRDPAVSTNFWDSILQIKRTFSFVKIIKGFAILWLSREAARGGLGGGVFDTINMLWDVECSHVEPKLRLKLKNLLVRFAL